MDAEEARLFAEAMAREERRRKAEEDAHAKALEDGWNRPSEDELAKVTRSSP